ncbi:hypothetical protein CPC08DRAFT_721752 [Agrocybe pediades]|nr:hypothetical protein CPC08DRAFT_721752 [Agrocybe pediades]
MTTVSDGPLAKARSLYMSVSVRVVFETIKSWIEQEKKCQDIIKKAKRIERGLHNEIRKEIINETKVEDEKQEKGSANSEEKHDHVYQENKINRRRENSGNRSEYTNKWKVKKNKEQSGER